MHKRRHTHQLPRHQRIWRRIPGVGSGTCICCTDFDIWSTSLCIQRIRFTIVGNKYAKDKTHQLPNQQWIWRQIPGVGSGTCTGADVVGRFGLYIVQKWNLYHSMKSVSGNDSLTGCSGIDTGCSGIEGGPAYFFVDENLREKVYYISVSR